MGTYRGDLLRDELVPALEPILDLILDQRGFHEVLNTDPMDLACDLMSRPEVVELVKVYDFDTGEVAEMIEEWQSRRRPSDKSHYH